ncbi:antitoxin [Nocardioides halotolerans]|jgi:hypothetical protein|uniref:antitoxin n=1 Tax=Nocardioides halotolerans TaxID=433660 RepID=UPI00048EF861|nr:antitoxin [Nocardioides halotolerans]
MGFLDDAKDKLHQAKDKVEGLVDGHEDKVADGVDKVAEVVDDKTGGKHTDKIESAAERAKDALGADGSTSA